MTKSCLILTNITKNLTEPCSCLWYDRDQIYRYLETNKETTVLVKSANSC